MSSPVTYFGESDPWGSRSKENFDHEPVLFAKVMDGLGLPEGGTIVDGTLGGAGHSEGILRRLGREGHLIGIDQDPSALEAARLRLDAVPERGRVTLVPGRFGDLEAHLEALGIDAVDGVLVDIGVSSPQLDRAERGFSFLRDGPLDMRMDPSREATAADLIAESSVEELARILREYGEERLAGPIARAIDRRRQERPITRTVELANLIEGLVRYRGRQGSGGKGGKKGARKGKTRRGEKTIHPATRSFQALRIAVNDELGELERFLAAAPGVLKAGGRVAVISFHSLEDRMVKRAFREEASDCICPPKFPICVCDKEARLKILTRKPLEGTEEEIAANPRARSARLRVAERLGESEGAKEGTGAS